MINCAGCRIDGVKTPYCDSLFPIRQCALGMGSMETCGDCTDVNVCAEVAMILENNEEARRNLRFDHEESRNQAVRHDYKTFF